MWLIPKQDTTKSHFVQALSSIEQILPPPHIFAIYLTIFLLWIWGQSIEIRLDDLL